MFCAFAYQAIYTPLSAKLSFTPALFFLIRRPPNRVTHKLLNPEAAENPTDGYSGSE